MIGLMGEWRLRVWDGWFGGCRWGGGERLVRWDTEVWEGCLGTWLGGMGLMEGDSRTDRRRRSCEGYEGISGLGLGARWMRWCEAITRIHYTTGMARKWRQR